MPPRKTSSARSPSLQPGRPSSERPSEDGDAGAAETSGGQGLSKLASGLHVVSTPIGNLGDLSPRALGTILAADLVLAEDTRVTAGLLSSRGASRRLLSYQEHNAARVRPEILERLAGGASVVLVSDAGTPLISDPGYKLVREAAERGIGIYAVPGPSAALAALVVSGLPSDRFMVRGFLPAGGAARRQAVAELRTVPATLILFESPRRLAATLGDLAAGLGPGRPAAVARELTKRFEEVWRGTLESLASERAAAEPPKGEIVIVVGPPEPGAPVADEALDAALAEALAHLPVSAAAAVVAACSGRQKREVYRRALGLQGR